MTMTFEDETISKYSLWLGVDGKFDYERKEYHKQFIHYQIDLIDDLNRIVK